MSKTVRRINKTHEKKPKQKQKGGKGQVRSELAMFIKSR